MAQLLFVRGARQLLTLRGPAAVRRGPALSDLGIVEDGSVLIRDGVIAAVGSTRRLENLKEARNAIEIPATGLIVMPGFIDPSLHLNLVEDPDNPRKHKRLSDFYAESLALMRHCLQHGTLTAEVRANAGHGDLRADLSVLRRLAGIGNNPVEMVRSWRVVRNPVTHNGHPDDVRELLAPILARRLAEFIDLPPHLCLSWKGDAGPAQTSPQMRVNLLWARGPAARLAELLSDRPPWTASCASQLSADEITVLANVPTIALFAPGREFLRGEPANSVRELADRGGAIALASGYDAYEAPSFSMQAALTLAVFCLGLSAEQAIAAATINAAHAVGLGHRTGSLEAGKRADVLLMNVPDYREIPRRFGTNHVGMAIREGNVVFNRTRWKVSTA